MGVLMKFFFFGHIFFLEGGQTKIFYGQTWANDGQTNAVSFFRKFEFGGAIFTELQLEQEVHRIPKRKGINTVGK